MNTTAATSARATRNASKQETVAELRTRVDALLSASPGAWSSETADGVMELHAELMRALEHRVEPDARTEELRELHRLASRLMDGTAIWLRAVASVQSAIERLADMGPASELVEHAVTEAAAAVDLDRVILSRVAEGCLVVDGFHDRADDTALPLALREAEVRLEYPLAEAEILRRRRAQIIEVIEPEALRRHAFGDIMKWDTYVASPIVLGARVVGLLHGDREPSRRPLSEVDREALWRFGDAFGGLFERAVLRRRLRSQRRELRQVASWADARTSALSDGAIDLATDRDADDGHERARVGPRHTELQELLTKRELDVLEIMGKGGTNADIARALVVSQGTVKFHVKNILRKLNAANRGEATSHYLRALGHGDSGKSGAPWTP